MSIKMQKCWVIKVFTSSGRVKKGRMMIWKSYNDLNYHTLKIKISLIKEKENHQVLTTAKLQKKVSFLFKN